MQATSAATVERPALTRVGDVGVVYDWLAANGVDEWLPDKPTIVVRGQRLEYEAFLWDGAARGWDDAGIADAVDDTGRMYIPKTWRTTALLVAPDAVVVEAAERGGAWLVFAR